MVSPASPPELTDHQYGRTSRRGFRRNARRAAVVTSSAFALLVALAAPALAAPPSKLPGKAEATESKWQPAYDYDTDGCYPTPAIGPTGAVNGGLNPTGSLSGDCHDTSDLDNTNGYARYKCNNGWCAVAYGLYFEKDQALANSSIGGHRHDWEHVVVWVQNDVAKYVSVSAHGDFDIYAAGSVLWTGNHPKIVYHKDGVSTHCFRLAGSGDEPPENAYHTWQYPTLVGWNGFPSTSIRTTLSNYDFGSAIFGLKDANFVNLITEAMPSGITFNPAA